MKQQKKIAANDSIEIKISAKPKYLKIIRGAVKNICEILEFCQEDTNNITLAVDEACSNIIKHAYGGPTDQPIKMTLNTYKNKLEIYLRDYGKKADIKKIKSRQLDDVRPGGLGVHLIKTVMDEVVFDNNFEQGNQLKLTKNIIKK